MSRTIAIMAGGVMLALLGGTFALTLLGTGPDCGASTMGRDAAAGPFELISETGQTVTRNDIITGPSLIYFGYTFCPDVCPLDAARNAAAADMLAEQGIDVATVFISIDPARDTAMRVADYTNNFHPDMIGLTGSSDQVAKAADIFGAVYQQMDDDPEYYLMQHSTLTYLVRPDTDVVVTFGRAATPEDVARQTACILTTG